MRIKLSVKPDFLEENILWANIEEKNLPKIMESLTRLLNKHQVRITNRTKRDRNN